MIIVIIFKLLNIKKCVLKSILSNAANYKKLYSSTHDKYIDKCIYERKNEIWKMYRVAMLQNFFLKMQVK